MRARVRLAEFDACNRVSTRLKRRGVAYRSAGGIRARGRGTSNGSAAIVPALRVVQVALDHEPREQPYSLAALYALLSPLSHRHPPLLTASTRRRAWKLSTIEHTAWCGATLLAPSLGPAGVHPDGIWLVPPHACRTTAVSWCASVEQADERASAPSDLWRWRSTSRRSDRPRATDRSH